MELKNLIFIAFVFALFFGNIAAQCDQNSKSVFVPAVVGESDGRLLQIKARSVDGTGKVYFSTTPNVGVSTQESQQSALENAIYFREMNSTQCDYLFTIEDMGESKYVEGPSAGAGMTIALIAVMSNQTVRQDVAFTGGIGQDGEITAVGGLAEKARAASANGKYAIVTPREEIFEKLMLADIAKKTGIRVIEVQNIREAANIAFSPEGEPLASSNITLEMPKIPENLSGNQQAFSDADLKVFAKISNSMIAIAENDITNAQKKANATSDYNRIFDFFRQDIENQKTLQAKGYLFTAANNVFTHLVDISLLEIGTVSETDLENAYAKSEACVSTMQIEEKNLGNFEWVSAAQLRQSWAQDKINNTKLSKSSGSEENYILYRDLVYAQNWCMVARLVLEASTEYTGARINESVLSDYAKNEIDFADKILARLPQEDADLKWHLDMAKSDYANGKYYPAIMDSQYVSGFTEADNDYKSKNITEIGNELDYLYNATFTSAWAKIYQTQGRYLYDAAGKNPAKGMTAYKILKFSQRLDTSFKTAQSTLMEKGKVSELNGDSLDKGSLGFISNIMQDYGAQAFAVAVLIIASALAIIGYYYFFAGKKSKKRKTRL